MKFENISKFRVILTGKTNSSVADMMPYTISPELSPAICDEVREQLDYHLSVKNIVEFKGKSQIGKRDLMLFEAVTAQSTQKSLDMNIQNTPSAPSYQKGPILNEGVISVPVQGSTYPATSEVILNPNLPIEAQLESPVMSGGHTSIEADTLGTIIQTNPANRIAGAEEVSLRDLATRTMSRANDVVKKTAEELVKEEAKDPTKAKKGPKSKEQKAFDKLPQDIKNLAVLETTALKIALNQITDPKFLKTLVDCEVERVSDLASRRLEAFTVTA